MTGFGRASRRRLVVGGSYYKELMGIMARNREKIAAKLGEKMQGVLDVYEKQK